MADYIVNLFQGMSILTIALLSAGVLLCIAEIFLPKIGISGILGIILIVSGLSSYYIDGYSISQIICLISFIALLLVIFICFELILEAKGVIKNPNRYKFRTYLNNPLEDMVGNVGKAITNIDLGGTIEINGELYYAVSNEPIAIGKIVQVIGVQNNSLIVKAQ